MKSRRISLPAFFAYNGESMKQSLSKILHFIASLKIAIILLILIATYIVIGTLIPQHSGEQWYLEAYPNIGKLIIGLQLDSAYSSPLFIVLVGFFTINLGTCTVLSLKGQYMLSRSSYFPSFSREEYSIDNIDPVTFTNFCGKNRYSVVKDLPSDTMKAAKFRWGSYGATITHIGILVLFVGGMVGNLLATEDVVSLLPGNEMTFEKEGFVLRLDDFYMTFEEEGAVKQYVSEVTLIDDDGTELQQTIWVNNPLHHKGVKLYQASFGWTGNLKITDSNTNEVLIEGLMRSGRTYFHQPSHLTIHLYQYLPDMAIGHDQQPVSLSNREDNPFFAVVLYEYGEPVGSYIIEPGQPIYHNDLEITFTHAEAYTGLMVRTDPSYPIVLVGFIIILLGMFVSFYCYPRFMRFSNGTITTVGRKNGWVFHHSVKYGLAKFTHTQPNGD
jgi:cytochrome c biogenesis protein